ncbi:Uncharacterised protein [Candidatus Bilamarchaeum dharawalense]|uniref:Uncharacterized protein n=1 Tax=Candidatus Bilamarchaeum dharawalense TaxID=2885759 RepID=A0A5E4LQ30_9ARCH|nr:Uncharacterised protein [Candidatus Bilamarchaeum dharawalense]
MASETYTILNQSWKKTCNLLFGQEVGELTDYSKWLSGLIDSNVIRKSNVSGKDVAFSIKEYPKNAKFISFDEVNFNQKFELDINEIKDLESLTQAISDRVYYCGNTVLGNSSHVERSANLTDCHFVTDTAQFMNSKYLAYCTVGRDSSNCFGVHGPGDTEFCIRCTQTFAVKRSFEVWSAQNCSDCYYISNLNGCSNCLFSFHLKNKKYCIGNLEIDRDKYLSIKKSLLEQMVDCLKQNKSLPSLLDITKKAKLQKPNFTPKPEQKVFENKKIIEDAFTNTSAVVLGKQLTKIDDYDDWLYTHAHKIEERKSAISGKRLLMLPYVIALEALPKDVVVTMDEAWQIGETVKFSKEEAENIRLDNIHQSIGKLAYFTVDIREGNVENFIESTVTVNAAHCYKASAVVKSKYCGCGMWPKNSENCFGFDTLFDSSFCITCYHSQKLVRCFEMDNCRDCSDSMFCHNCEGLSNCMFCFNIKGKRYAIGNVEVGREQYLKIKKKVLDEINKKLEKDKKINNSIYSL